MKTLTSPNYAWPTNTLVSATEIGGGYLLGVFVGVTLALLFSWSRIFTLLLLPLCVSLNMIPKVALGPLFIVWFSYGIMPNILIAFSICFFPVLLTTARGLSESTRQTFSISFARSKARAGSCFAKYSCRALCLMCSPA